MSVSIEGIQPLMAKLESLQGIDFSESNKKLAKDIESVARQYTPVDTGKLIGSLVVDGDTVGFTADYAPHVEYGHRTRSGGYVEGQYFLKQTIEQIDGKQAEYIRKQLEDA